MGIIQTVHEHRANFIQVNNHPPSVVNLSIDQAFEFLSEHVEQWGTYHNTPCALEEYELIIVNRDVDALKKKLQDSTIYGVKINIYQLVS